MAVTERYNIKKAYADSQAKQSVERQTKISMVYRKKQELDALQEELDSAAVKFDVNKTEAQNKAELIVPLQNKIKKAEKALNEEHKKIINSSDPKLVSEYNSSLKDDEDGKSIASTVNYSPKTSKKETSNTMGDTKKTPSKYNYGLKNHEGEDILLKGKYATEDEKLMLDTELAKIEVTHGERSDEAKKFRQNQFEKVYLPEIRDGYRKKLEDAEKRFANAKTPEEVRSSKKDIQNFSKMYERTNTKNPWVKQNVQNIWTDDDAKGADLPINYTDWVDQFRTEIEEPTVVETEKEATVTPEYQGDDEVTPEVTPEVKEEVVEDITLLPKKNADGTYDYTGSTNDPEADLEKAQEDLASLQNVYSTEREPFVYAPDSQSDADLVGNLGDIGRGIAGMIGATKEIPVYERGSMWQTAMGEAEKRRDEGLSADELNYRNRQAETAYAYDIKNIRRGVGGSAGAYLGNIGRAQAGLYDQYGKTAAIDEGQRRINRQNFQQMAGKDEAINRQIFQDELSQTIATKEQGAALVSDALRNVSERADYRKAYGKDSPYYQYNRDLAEEAHNTRQDRLIGNQGSAERVGLRGANYNVNKAQEAVDKTSLTPGETPTTETPTTTTTTTEVPASGEKLVQETVAETPKETVGGKVVNAKIDEGGKLVSTEKPKKTTTDAPYTETDKEGNVRKFDSNTDATVNKAQGFKKARPTEYKKELDNLKEARKYGGLDKTQKARLKALKKALKDDDLTDEDKAKFKKMLEGSNVTTEDLEGAK